MKKKIFIILLAAVMTVSAGACGKEKQEDGAQQTQTDDKNTNGKKEDNVQAEADSVSYDVSKCVKLGNYSGMKISLANTYKVTKEQIEDYALNAAKANAQPVYKDTKKKKVEKGDTVNIDYEGKKDGAAFVGGSAQGYNLTIGSNSFIDGFEDGLIGAKTGQTLDLNLTFPENYPTTDLAGADVVFTVTVNKIVVEDPDAEFELNDEYIQNNTSYKTVKEYKEGVKSYLQNQTAEDKERDTRQAVIDKLLKTCEVTVPDDLLEARVADHITIFTKNNCEDGQTLSDFLSASYNGMSEDDFRSTIKDEMLVNLQTELILEAIVEKEGIKLDEDAYQEFVEQQMGSYGFEKAEDFYQSNGVTAKSGEAYERKVYVCNRALDNVVADAKITYGVAPEEDEK